MEFFILVAFFSTTVEHDATEMRNSWIHAYENFLALNLSANHREVPTAGYHTANIALTASNIALSYKAYTDVG